MTDGPMFYITRSGTVHTTTCGALLTAAEVLPWSPDTRTPTDRRCQRCFPATAATFRRDAKPRHDAH